MRGAILTLAGLTCCGAFGQQTFDVISIKPRPRERVGYTLTRECVNDRFRAANEPLSWIIQWAYGLRDYQIAGLPEWTATFQDSYEIDAKAAAPVNEDQCRIAVRAMLADRFQMQARHETRDLPVYDLVIAKKGSRLRDASTDGSKPGAIINGTQQIDSGDKPPKGWPVSRLASVLSDRREVGRPVIDKTGLTGVYSFQLTFSIKEGDERPSIFTAVEEQLGLKLTPSRAPIEVLAIDRIERPGAN